MKHLHYFHCSEEWVGGVSVFFKGKIKWYYYIYVLKLRSINIRFLGYLFRRISMCFTVQQKRQNLLGFQVTRPKQQLKGPWYTRYAWLCRREIQKTSLPFGPRRQAWLTIGWGQGTLRECPLIPLPASQHCSTLASSRDGKEMRRTEG